MIMPLGSYIWLLLCYANHARGNLIEEFESIATVRRHDVMLPIELGIDKKSGCFCRASAAKDLIVCFGPNICTSFPKVSIQTGTLKVKTTNIKKILKGDTDALHALKVLEIDSNHNLESIQAFSFRNLSHLEHLSISYNYKLVALDENLFEGLYKLTNLTLVSNGFENILDITRALKPNIAPALGRLDISENFFVTVHENDFTPMIGSTVSEIEIVLCQTDDMHKKSLNPLKNLKSLHIGENNMNASVIGELLFEMKDATINLYHLDISRMGFRKAPSKRMLEIIANTTVKRLVLAQNQFEMFLNDTFPRMQNLELLDLRQVLTIYIAIDAFAPSKFPNLKVLLLNGNNLSGLPGRLSTELKILDLSYNSRTLSNPGYFEMPGGVFTNMTRLEVLNLSYNRIMSIYNYTFQGLRELKILSLKNGTIFNIMPYAFKHTPSLKMLTLENNPFLQNNEIFDRSTFEGLDQLRVLVLSNCGARSFRDNFFTVFPNLTHLILKNNKLLSLTKESLKPMTKLEVLDLSNNLIVAWSNSLFKPFHAPIKSLLLNNNKITRFTVSMLEDMKYILSDNSNKSEIDLLGNVFTCDCNSMYVAHWWVQVNGSRRLKEYFNEAEFVCTSPEFWEDVRVSTFLSRFDNLKCSMYYSKIRTIVMTLAAIFSVLALASLVMLVYHYRFYISYWLFLAKLALGRRHITKTSSSMKELTSKTNFKYDAFVSYSSEDRDFVIDMVSELETNTPFFKLCVYERDFEIGSFISESIHSSINESKYIILVISDHFAKSQWCRWETQLAEYHRLFSDGDYNYDPLVLVRVGEVQNKNLTPTLKYLLKTKIYLQWQGDKKQEFWNKLKNVLTKRNS